MIAPAHGAIWRDNPMQIVDLYDKWSREYQEDQVTVVYDTMWEGTTKIAHEIAAEVARQSPSTVVKVFSIAHADKNEIMTEVFKSKAIAVGSPTVLGSGQRPHWCNVCGYVYDPERGDPDNGIAPGTAFEDISDDWTCPVCGVSKEDFSPAD